MPNTAIIDSIGTAVPAHVISQELHHNILESANGINRADRLMLKRVFQNSGIISRHSVLEEFGKEDSPDNMVFHPAGKSDPVSISKRMAIFDIHASDLCYDAVKDCVQHNPSILEKVTHLITFSCTGMSAPGIDIQLIEKLGLKRNIERTCINFMGCYAGINALKMANYIVLAQPEAIVLLAGVELCTLHYQKILSQDQLIANAIFSDGASAAIVCSDTSGDRSKARFSLRKFYSEFEPSGKNEMAWKIGDHGFDIRLSSYVPDLIRDNIAALMKKLFHRSGLSQSDIDFYAFHPGGVKILEACEKALGISTADNQNSYDVLKKYGNMSSVTVFFVLKKYFEQLTSADRGKKILSCAFGPGLTMESMILDVV